MTDPDLDDPLFDAATEAANRMPLGEPEPGTLHGITDLAAEPEAGRDVVCWAHDVAALDALRSAGFPLSVCLVPAGKRDVFLPLRDHADVLGTVKKFVLAGGPRPFIEELARRLGRHRVCNTTWPEGCTDAADAMKRIGVEAIRHTIDSAEPYPIEGIYQPTPAAMLAYRHAPAPPVLTTGCFASDKNIHLPGEGKLIVVTGIPSMGKSTVVSHLMAHTATAHNRRWAVFSPEMGEWQGLCASVISWRAAKPFRAPEAAGGMTDAEITEGSEWAKSRFAYLAADGEGDAPTLDWWLERVAVCILRYGITDALIDPWNELEHDEKGRTETAYIGRCLQRLRAFAARHGCNVWIVAHPTKLRSAKPNEPIPVPNAYDINGGAQWFNKADVIIVVHRPEVETELHLLKARFRRWGNRGSVSKLKLDHSSGRFQSADAATTAANDAPAWVDDAPPSEAYQ